MDWSGGHELPPEWQHPGLYGYDPYTNTFVPLPYYGYGFGLEYSWIPPDQQQGPIPVPYSGSSQSGPPHMAGAQRGRGHGRRQAQRGRGGRPPPPQHGGPGLLGADPSSQPPAQIPPPVPPPPPLEKREKTPPPPPASSSPSSSHAMSPPVSDLVKKSHVVDDVSMTADSKMDDGKDDVSGSSKAATGKKMSLLPLDRPAPLKNSDVDVSMTANAKMGDGKDDVLVGLSGSSSTAATGKKRSLLPLDRPALLKNSDVDVSMDLKDDDQGDDVLGLKAYKAKKRLLSTKAWSLPTDADSVDSARKKKSRLGWGQGLAKYENRGYKKDDETTHNKLVAHDGATGEAASSSHGSSPPAGSKGHGGNNSLDDMAGMRVSHATTVPELSSKGTRLPLTGDLSHLGKNGSIGSLTKKAVSPAEMRSLTKKAVFPAEVPGLEGTSEHNQNLKEDGFIGDLPIIFPKVYAVPRKGSLPPEDKSISGSSTREIAVSDLASSSQGSDHDAPPDESSMKFSEAEDDPPRPKKIVITMVQRPRNIILPMNVLCDEEPETAELQGLKLKEWSEKEKDIFSVMITIFGMNFSKVSSFLTHKTAADCMKYYSEHYKSECHKEAQKCLPTTVMQSQENCCNENDDAAALVSGIATVTATKKYERMNAKAEDVKKPENQISHESIANLLAHSLPDKGHGESSVDEHEHVTGKVLVGESNSASSPLGTRPSQSACLTISKTEAPVLENFNEDSCSNEAVCITKSSSSKVKENLPQSVLIANQADEENCVAGGSFGQDTLKIIFFPDERSAKLANGIINGDQIRNGAMTAELYSSLKECNDSAKHHSWKATEKKLANSNIDDGRMASSDMKNPKSKDNPCITSDPAAMLRGPAFVQHMMEVDEAMEKKESEKNDDKVKGKEGNNPVLCVASKHGSGIQLSCEVNSQKEMEKVDSISSPEGNDLNADMETPTKDSSPCLATNASVVRVDGLIQLLRASEAIARNSENNDAKVKSNKGNPVHSVASSKESNGIQLSCNVTAQKGKGIMPSPEVNDLNAPPMQISNGPRNTYHLSSSSGSAALDMVHANSSYIAMDIDLNIPLDVTPIDLTSVDLGSSTAEASMGRSSEATDSDATMEMISASQTTTTVTQTAQQQPANQPGSILLFGRVIYQALSTGTTNHTPNQGNQIVISSSNMPSNPVVPVIRPRGRGQVYPSWATTTSVWRNSIQNIQHSQQAMLSNRILYGSSTTGASASAASPLQLQPGSSALINMMNQQRQPALANITPYSIMRGGVSVVPSPLIPGSSGGAASFVNFNGFSAVQQQQWSYPVVDTSRMVLGHPFYYPGATANQASATVTTILSIGTNNGEGASTSNARAPPAAGRGRGRRTGGHNSWLSLGRN